MTDQELADKVVALLYPDGIWQTLEVLGLESWAELHGEDAVKGLIVRDWRVAGALMERCRDRLVYLFECDVKSEYMPVDESLPREIIAACVEALND